MNKNNHVINSSEDQNIAKDILQDSYLSFRLDNELFAVEVQRVSQILEVPAITKIPKAPDYLTGIVNLRGKVLPLVDAKIKFDLEPINFTVDTSIIVIDIAVGDEVIQTGILVDAVLEVLEIDSENIQPSPVIDARYDLSFIQGMYKKKEDFIMLLDLNEVFSLQDVEYMRKAEEAKRTRKTIKEPVAA